MFELSGNSLDFSSGRKRLRELQLTSLIDVVFILIVFFMLTSTFMKIESMEVMLPSAGARGSEKKDVVRIVIHNDNSITFGQRKVDADELDQTLQSMFLDNPSARVMLLTDSEVSMQTLVTVMDTVQVAGGKALFVKAWKPEDTSVKPKAGK